MKKFRLVERVTRFGNLKEIKEYVIQKRKRSLFWEDYWKDYKLGSCWDYGGRVRAVFHDKEEALAKLRNVLVKEVGKTDVNETEVE